MSTTLEIFGRHDPAIVGLKADPLLRSLRDDARYAALLKKLKLPEK